jgi:hypothetical protein
MQHPNQSILCSLCQLTFRSHRSLKTHQQRRHSSIQAIRVNSNVNAYSTLPNYGFISSYLVLAFSSKQFPLIAMNACQQERLPLGSFSSQLYRCYSCHLSFPCSRTLNYHQLDRHDYYEYILCKTILHDIVLHVEETCRTVNDNLTDDDDIESMKLHLARQAVHIGIKNKQLVQYKRSMKIEHDRLIYPLCQHEDRTCANLCLQYLSSYSKLIQNYPYQIQLVPKGNPFAQGSIVSHLPSTATTSALVSNTADANLLQETIHGRHKRRNRKPIDGSSSPQLKRKSLVVNVSSTNTKSNRSATIKQQIDVTSKVKIDTRSC